MSDVLVCIECGDNFKPFKCPLCRRRKSSDSRCEECHLEILHGKIVIGENSKLCGNTSPEKYEDLLYEPRIPTDMLLTWEDGRTNINQGDERDK